LIEGEKEWLTLKVIHTCSCSVSKSSSSAPMICGPTRDKGLPTPDWESWGELGAREEKVKEGKEEVTSAISLLARETFFTKLELLL